MAVSRSEVLADREHRYAPPPRLLHEALTSGVQRWLRLRPREVWPEILEADAPTRVVWSSLWPVSPGDRIEFHIRNDGEDRRSASCGPVRHLPTTAELG